MEIQGTHQFSAPLDKVWDALLNPAVLAKAMPGNDQLERVGENDYKAAMSVRVGPVQGRFEGQVTLTDIDFHKGYRMKVSGTGAPGFLNGEGTLSLSENDDGTLLTYAGDVQVGGRIAAVGQRLIDSTAKSIIRQGLKALDEQLQKGDAPDTPQEPTAPSTTTPAAPTDAPAAPNNVAPAPSTAAPSTATSATATSSASGPSPSPTPVPQPAPSSQAGDASASEFGRMAFEVAKEVAQDLVSDYVPREKQPQFFAFIGGALAMLLFVVLVRLVQDD